MDAAKTLPNTITLAESIGVSCDALRRWAREGVICVGPHVHRQRCAVPWRRSAQREAAAAAAMRRRGIDLPTVAVALDALRENTAPTGWSYLVDVDGEIVGVANADELARALETRGRLLLTRAEWRERELRMSKEMSRRAAGAPERFRPPK